MQKSVTDGFALPFASQVVMLILHNPATKETLVQTAQVRSRVAEIPVREYDHVVDSVVYKKMSMIKQEFMHEASAQSSKRLYHPVEKAMSISRCRAKAPGNAFTGNFNCFGSLQAVQSCHFLDRGVDWTEACGYCPRRP